jgi:hypothetical protein
MQYRLKKHEITELTKQNSVTNSRIAMQICTNNMMIWRHKIKKIRNELNNYELSRIKDLIQENSRNLRNQLNYLNFQETQSILLKDSRIKTYQLPNDQGFFKHVFGQNSNKVIFFSHFFLCSNNQDFKIKPDIYIYIYIQQE